MAVYSCIVSLEQDDMRIDKFLAEEFPALSRSRIQKLIKENLVKGKKENIKANYRVTEGEEILFSIPPVKELEIVPEEIPLEILYEDEDVILVNKPKNMVVHPAAGHVTGTLVNALLYHCKGNLSGINGVIRPGIVHRIDKDTTGVLIVCKNDLAHQSIAAQLKEHSITRKYRAIVHGKIKEDGIVDAPIGRSIKDRKKMAINEKNGKHAVTHYHVISNLGEKYTYIECQLETGRTHQIRVHMASIGHPLLGDTVYGPAKTTVKSGQCLHAMVLGFVHPRTGKYMEFEAKLPQYFEELLEKYQSR